jgi:hypothetical protein
MNTKTRTTSLTNLTKKDIMSLLPNDNKALKYAFYNVIALVVAGLSILALYAVYIILEPFIRPLLWALLFGSVSILSKLS